MATAEFHEQLREFIRESNRIEGITRDPSSAEYAAHHRLIFRDELSIEDLIRFVGVCQPDAELRDRAGLNVRVGNHFPPPGGLAVPFALDELLVRVNDSGDPFACHVAYETLHPFTDGNGRSGRAVWLWQMLNQSQDRWALKRGFLHTFYYQSLAARSAPGKPVTEGDTRPTPPEQPTPAVPVADYESRKRESVEDAEHLK